MTNEKKSTSVQVFSNKITIVTILTAIFCEIYLVLTTKFLPSNADNILLSNINWNEIILFSVLVFQILCFFAIKSDMCNCVLNNFRLSSLSTKEHGFSKTLKKRLICSIMDLFCLILLIVSFVTKIEEFSFLAATMLLITAYVFF